MWEERYKGTGEYLFGKAPAQFLLDNPGWLKSGSEVLVVADGEGRNSVHIAGFGAHVQAFDLSETAVARAQELARERGVDLDTKQSDWAGWDWQAKTYDLVVAIFVQFVAQKERIAQFENLKQSVKPGGVLMLHGYRPEQIELGTGGPPFVENMYTEDMLHEFFAGWQIERLASYERDVQEGRGHSGKSALIDLIAHKPV